MLELGSSSYQMPSLDIYIIRYETGGDSSWLEEALTSHMEDDPESDVMKDRHFKGIKKMI